MSDSNKLNCTDGNTVVYTQEFTWNHAHFWECVLLSVDIICGTMQSMLTIIDTLHTWHCFHLLS